MLLFLRQHALHDHRRHRDPDLDHRHLRADLVHGLHAQRHDPAGADARGRHRHRRRHRGAREHLSGSSRRRACRRCEAAVEATKEIGLAVLATTLSLVAVFVPVGVHGRHRRPLHAELRPDHGVRHHGVAAGQLHADADAVARWLQACPSAKTPPATLTTPSIRGFFVHIDRTYAAMLAWAMRHRVVMSVAAVLVLPVERPALHDRQQASCRTTTRRSSRSTCARPRAPASRRPRCSPTRRRGGQAAARGGLHAGHHRPATAPRRGTSPTIYVRLTPIGDRQRDQFEVMDAVRKDVLPLVAKAGLRTSVQPVATIGGGGAQAADIQFVHQRARPEGARRLQPAAASRRSSTIPAGRRRHSLNVGKPELSVHDRPAQGGRPRRADRRRGRGAAPAGRRRQVTTYNEGGEQYEVHLRASAQDRDDRGGHCRPHRAVVAARQRRARERRQLLARVGAGRHQPRCHGSARSRSRPTCCPGASQSDIAGGHDGRGRRARHGPRLPRPP